MNIHEYQGKAIFKSYGLPCPAGYPAMTVAEAVEGAKKLPGPLYVVKSQIHAGGRGKGKFKELPAEAKGGVRLAVSIDEVEKLRGKCSETRWSPSRQVRLASRSTAFTSRMAPTSRRNSTCRCWMDRETGKTAFVVSTEGGMDIEKVAHDTPEKIITFSVDPATGVKPHHGRAVAKALGLSGPLPRKRRHHVQALQAFVEKDMSLLEVNPLIITKQGHLKLLDAKIGFDSNALYRHADVVDLRERLRGGREGDRGIEVRPLLYRTRRHHRLHGERAGLAMATMDIIKLYGAEPPTSSMWVAAPARRRSRRHSRSSRRPQCCRASYVNIFGGIMSAMSSPRA